MKTCLDCAAQIPNGRRRRCHPCQAENFRRVNARNDRAYYRRHREECIARVRRWQAARKQATAPTRGLRAATAGRSL